MYTNRILNLLLRLIPLALSAGIPMTLHAQPRLFYSDLQSGPNSGGENNNGVWVTIYGERFGSSQGSSIVTVGGGAAAAYRIWSDTKITFQPGPAAATGNIVVSNAAGTSNGLPFTVRSGRILFVATNGSDGNDGSFSAPWATVTHARDSVQAGDTVYLMNGVSQTQDDGQGWNACFTIGGISGAAGAPIAFVGYPGATATIGNVNESACSSGIRTKGENESHWVFAELSLRGGTEAMAIAAGSDWRAVANDMTCPNGNSESGCMATEQSSNWKFFGNTVHDTGAANATAEYHGVYFSTDSNHVEMGWNTIYNVHGCRGVQFHSSPLNGGGASDPTGHNQFDIQIHDNVIHDTQCDGIILATIDPSQGPVQVYNNIIYNAGKGPNNPENSGTWSCLAVPGYTNTGSPGGGTVQVYNNTFYNCGSFANPPYAGASGGVLNGGGNLNLLIQMQDNIIDQPAGNTAPYLVIYGSSGGVCADSQNCNGIGGSHNLFYGNGPAPANSNITNSVNSDPLFVNASQANFHLNSGSPAATGGMATSDPTDFDGYPLPQGSGFPIGAYSLPNNSTTPSSGVLVTLNPASVSLDGGATQQFTASVTGSSNSAVSWSLNPMVGTLSNGLYTAPAVVTSAQTVLVTATSSADSTKSATATIHLTPVGIAVTPASVTLGASGSQQFSATVTGTTNNGVSWTMSPNVGSLSSSGMYQAPSSISSQQMVTITATSVADNTKSATAVITLTASTPSQPATLAVSPGSVSLSAGQSQQFKATETGMSAPVTWSMTPNVGTLSASGLYTAPAAIASAQTVTVIATTNSPAMTASATINLAPFSSSSSSGVGGVYSVSGGVSGTTIKVSWTAPANHLANDYIVLSSVDAPAWYSLASKKLTSALGGSFNFTLPSTPGLYEIRYFLGGTRNLAAASSPIAVGVAGTSVTPSSLSISSGQTVSFSWTAPAAKAGDAIGLYAVSATSDNPVWWIATDGKTSGETAGFGAPPPGNYELRYISQSGYILVAKSAVITVH
jgi:hypothetical protein